MKVMVVTDLAGICKKVAENAAVPDELRAQARGMVEEFNSLLPVRGKGNPSEHAQGEALLIKMGRFLTGMADLPSTPADSSRLWL